MRTLIASLKLALLVLNSLWVIPLQSLLLLFTKGPAIYILPSYWHRIAGFIFGIKPEINGAPHTGGQTLYMSNHISYLDIPLLGGVIKSSFLAKSEVKGWAVFGFLADLQRTAYIRRQRSKIAEEKNALQSRLSAGESMIIFPEGTSTSGYEVEPFKSGLFSLALNDPARNMAIQPITIRIVEVNGKPPETKEERDLYAWPRDVDIELHHHLWRFAKLRGAILEITFHPAMKALEYQDRKTLAKACHERVSKRLETATIIKQAEYLRR
ncbi:MAG: 1-acyl-sn-glycerol-3-phosphate acyltransferase [Alphaproteobacteria bacterium]|nr:1-acyl-sn-glycerol-3-phosphate acyltransferase [Alphaproteobacteria bacterium]